MCVLDFTFSSCILLVCLKMVREKKMQSVVIIDRERRLQYLSLSTSGEADNSKDVELFINILLYIYVYVYTSTFKLDNTHISAHTYIHANEVNSILKMRKKTKQVRTYLFQYTNE